MNDDTSQTNDDLASQALADANGSDSVSGLDTMSDEVEQSDQVAQTITSLQNVIERNANELGRISEELKHKRESLKNVFENDAELATAEEQVQLISTQLKERKAKLQADPQVTTLKVQIGELNEQKKEVEETLSNHLVNYHTLTGSKSFDTSDGDQWDFDVRAKVKARKKS
jgi:chromosome segregation ATPase